MPSHYSFPPHIEFLCSIVDKLISGEYKKVAISTPPGHGKSDTITRPLPIFWGLQHPRDAVVFTGYNQTFADRNLSKPAREIAREMGVLSFGTEAMSEWELTNGARMIARGVGSAPTGINPISLIVADDPLKDRAQAESPVERQNVWDWWTGSIVQRFWPRTRGILIQTRWHKDDLIGRLQEKNDPDWTFINLPAIAELNDPLGREVGEALWPEEKPLEFLEEIRSQIGEYNFQSLYQGNPYGLAEKLFEPWMFEDRYIQPENVPKLRNWYRGVDTAMSDKAYADSSATARAAFNQDGDLYLRGFAKKKLQPGPMVDWMGEIAEKEPRNQTWICEMQTNGSAVADYLMRLGFPIVRQSIGRGQGGKRQRAFTLHDLAHKRKVFIVMEGQWQEFMQEIWGFTGDPNMSEPDDLIDAVTVVLTHLKETPSKNETETNIHLARLQAQFEAAQDPRKRGV